MRLIFGRKTPDTEMTAKLAYSAGALCPLWGIPHTILRQVPAVGAFDFSVKKSKFPKNQRGNWCQNGIN
jgi:hypothetical protein